ncbi:helix-turn-helix transcriptional regulator [Tenacibaculum sp. C7A-26P2]|uniref:helix-turn-helix transcriptional regulator n=1 Tax=Tenacibaculum sp. C7A-26P2 TaxID=3447504 RepID=UPI003F8686DB
MVEKQRLHLNDVFEEQHHSFNSNSGIVSKKCNMNPKYGRGSITSYCFDGLQIEYINMTFNEDYAFYESSNINTLELCLLLSGEKKLKNSTINLDIIQQEQECLLFSSYEQKLKNIYLKNTYIKEFRIKMYYEFIKKHQLINLINYAKQLDLNMKNNNFFIASTSSKSYQIIEEILLDKSIGIFKKLFFEAKILELVSTLRNRKSIGSSPQSLITKLYDVKKIILSNLNEPFSVKELAKKVLLNDTILKKEYKRVFNTTISEFSLKVRMNKAKELLSHTNKPIYEISDIVGYKNPTHFSAAFKKYIKKTPKQYRSQTFDK